MEKWKVIRLIIAVAIVLLLVLHFIRRRLQIDHWQEHGNRPPRDIMMDWIIYVISVATALILNCIIH